MAEEASGFQVKRLVRFEGEGTVKAYCDLAIGSLFLIRGLRIVQGKNGMFVSMPRQQGKDQKWYERPNMTQQNSLPYNFQPEPDRRIPTGPQSAASQPMFFYDGDFRTWGQVVLRSRINQSLYDFANRSLVN